MKKAIIGILSLILVIGIFAFIFLAPKSATGNVVKNLDDSIPVKEFVIESYTEIIDGKYFPQFSQKEIAVNKGDRVRIKITNIKGTHDFRIDEFDAYTETPLNEQASVEFVADKEGEFEYYCTKPGHRANGHWGTLKVSA